MAQGQVKHPNPYITEKTAETITSVQLHPLVLLTISDYITRHVLRRQEGPVVGAIIGQQNGRGFTLEHAYEVRMEDGRIHHEWFEQRLEQYRDVHKAPALDLVGIFMLGAVSGPTDAHVGIVNQVQMIMHTSQLMILLFHPGMVGALQGGKLPITLYESVNEGDNSTKFRELNYEVETGEAEMISVDFVATTSGNAAAVTNKSNGIKAEALGKKDTDKLKGIGKGKAKAKETDSDEAESNALTSSSLLSAEEEALVASLTTKVNAIKMLNQRINLIKTYLTRLPPSTLTDANSPNAPPENTNHALLRSISAMLSRLPLLHPPNPTADISGNTESPSHQEQTSVHVTSLLSVLTRSLAEAQAMNVKFNAFQRGRPSKDRGPGGKGPVFPTGDINAEDRQLIDHH